MAGIPVYTASPISPDSPTLSLVSLTADVDPTPTDDFPGAVPIMTTVSALSSSSALPEPEATPDLPDSLTAAAQYCPATPTKSATPPTLPYTPSVTTAAPPTPGPVPSPYVPSHAAHARKASMPPPPRTISTPTGMSVRTLPPLNTNNTDQPANHTLPTPLSTVHQSPSFNNPFGTQSNQRSGQFKPRHTRDLSSPPGYTQNFQASFEDRPSLNPSVNDSPFSSNGYTPGHSRSWSMSPLRRGSGILDNDPSIYLPRQGSTDQGMFGFGSSDEVWDTASRWARSATKRLSESEAGLWKLVSGER